jgi:ubiquitin
MASAKGGQGADKTQKARATVITVVVVVVILPAVVWLNARGRRVQGEYRQAVENAATDGATAARQASEVERDKHLAAAREWNSKKDYTMAMQEYDAAFSVGFSVAPSKSARQVDRVGYAVAAVMSGKAESEGEGGLLELLETLPDSDLESLRDGRVLPPSLASEVVDPEQRARLTGALADRVETVLELKQTAKQTKTADKEREESELHTKVILGWADRHMDTACSKVLEKVYEQAEAHPERKTIVIEVWTDKEDLLDEYGNPVKEDLLLGVVRFPDPSEVRRFRDSELFASKKEWQEFVESRLTKARNLLK